MGIILYIGDSEKISGSIENLPSGRHKVALGMQSNYKHYIEEYMPDYILLSDDVDKFEEISDFISRQTGAKLIVAGDGKDGGKMIPGAARIECPRTDERFLRIVQAIDMIEDGEKAESREYRFLKQEVISFYSVQGGTGKTSVSFNAALRFAEKGMGRVLLIDLNFCEGPSDLQLDLGIASSGLDDFTESVMVGEADIRQNIDKITEGLDIACPSASLYKSDMFNIDMLHDLVYSARNEYDLVLADLPFGYGNIALEMINISTTSVLVMSGDMRRIPRIRAFNKFLPGSQKKLAVLNKIDNEGAFHGGDVEDITDLALYASIPFIAKKDRKYIRNSGRQTGIIDLRPQMDNFIDKVF